MTLLLRRMAHVIEGTSGNIASQLRSAPVRAFQPEMSHVSSLAASSDGGGCGLAGGRRADLSGAADRVLGRAAGVRCIDVITE